MAHIVLSEEQARVVMSALGPVEVRDPRGRVLGTLPPAWAEEEVAQAKRVLATNQRWHSTQDVLTHLRSLEQQ